MCDSSDANTSGLRVVVVGCGHGELNAIYQAAEFECEKKSWSLASLDFLIVCGDFQAFRNSSDLNCASIPRRYRRLCDFHEYYSGKRIAPILTIVIGGNHEASNYLFELYHGGWLAPNIYYLGAAGVIRYGSWRIAGLSGIFHPRDYRRPHVERLPYDRDDIKSVYHVRDFEVNKLLQITDNVDICLSHDWPMWVELFGDYEKLYNEKSHFFESAKRAGLGSLPAFQLLGKIRPRYWLSGHMHTRFEAVIGHSDQSITDTMSYLDIPRAIREKLPIFKKREDSTSQLQMSGVTQASETKFLALGKPGQDDTSYMALLELDLPLSQDRPLYSQRDENGKCSLHYDEEWLAITRAFNEALRIPDPSTLIVPPAERRKDVSSSSVARHRRWIHDNVTNRGLLKIPHNFEIHAPVHDPSIEETDVLPPEYPNSQTVKFAELLGMTNRFAMAGPMTQDDAEVDFIDFTGE